MGYATATVGLIQKAGMNQGTGVLRNGFYIGSQHPGKRFNGNTVMFIDSAQNGDPPMIGRPLKVPFQLFWRFHIS